MRNPLLSFIPVLAALSLCFGGTVPPVPTATNIRPDRLFSSNMVLQRNAPTRVWGTADPYGVVEVRIAAQVKRCAVDQDGRWAVDLDPMPAGGPHKLIVAGDRTSILKNAMIGDVWVCAGQSNMQMGVDGCLNSDREMADAANYPNIRFFTSPMCVAPEPLDESTGSWEVCSRDTAGDFSGVGYFFGRALHKKLQVPIGLIQAAHGGTRIEAWTSRKAMESDPALKPTVESHDAALKEDPDAAQHVAYLCDRSGRRE